MDISSTLSGLDKPLRPVFITPESSMEIKFPETWYPVILVTASRPVPSGYRRVEGGFMYVQGAADDEEAWSHGLKSVQFWDNHTMLLECSREEEVIKLIEGIVGERTSTNEIEKDVSVIASTGLSLGIGDVTQGKTTILVCGETRQSELEDINVLYLHIPTKSKPITLLTQKIFPQAIAFALDNGVLTNSPISILATDSSRQTLDLSISITLILLSLFFDDNGISPSFSPPFRRNLHSKDK